MSKWTLGFSVVLLFGCSGAHRAAETAIARESDSEIAEMAESDQPTERRCEEEVLSYLPVGTSEWFRIDLRQVRRTPAGRDILPLLHFFTPLVDDEVEIIAGPKLRVEDAFVIARSAHSPMFQLPVLDRGTPSARLQRQSSWRPLGTEGLWLLGNGRWIAERPRFTECRDSPIEPIVSQAAHPFVPGALVREALDFDEQNAIFSITTTYPEPPEEHRPPIRAMMPMILATAAEIEGQVSNAWLSPEIHRFEFSVPHRSVPTIVSALTRDRRDPHEITPGHVISSMTVFTEIVGATGERTVVPERTFGPYRFPRDAELLDASTMVDGCEGLLLSRPQFTFEVESPEESHRVGFVSHHDLFTVVERPNGSRECIDDSATSTPVAGPPWDVGAHRFYVGMKSPIPNLLFSMVFAEPDSEPDLLAPTALPTSPPEGSNWRTQTVFLSQQANQGNVLTGGTTEFTYSLEGIPGCEGFSGAAQHRLVVDGEIDRVSITAESTGDIRILVKSSEGEFQCSEPGMRTELVTSFEQGEHLVWVAGQLPGTSNPYSLAFHRTPLSTHLPVNGWTHDD